MNIDRLINRGRLLPIKKTDSASPTGWMLVGYRRKSSSRKSGQEFYLKTPRACTPPPNRGAEPTERGAR